MNMKKATMICTAIIISLLLGNSLCAQKQPKDKFDFPKLNEIRMPDIKQVTLKNGLKLLLVEDHDFPTIDMRGMINTGSVHEPAAKCGLASLTGTALRTGGTTRMNGDEIDRKLETMAATIETGIGDTDGFIYVSMLKENLDQVLPIMADILRRPAFAQDKIDLAKTEQRAVIARRNDDIGGITNREFNKIIYGANSPYARQPEYATIDAINRDDILQYYQTYFHPEQMIIAIWGDFNTSQMVKKLTAALDDWPTGPATKPHPPVVDYKYISTVNHIEKTDVNQSNIMIGHIGGLMNNPDYPALAVMNRILSFDRMFKTIRTDEGLAYSVWGDYGVNFEVPGTFSAGAQTKSQSTVKAINLMLSEIKKIAREEVSDLELKRAKDQFLNSYVFQFQNKRQIVNRMLTYAFHGYPLDFSQQLFKKIEAVTKADILKAAQKCLKPDQLQILVVGKKADFDQPLSTLGNVNEIDITIPVPKGEAAPAATAESLTQGRQWFEKAIRAMGDPQKIAAIKATAFKGEMVTQGMTLPIEAAIQYPDRVRLVLTTPQGTMVMKINQGKGIVETPQGNMPLPDVQVKMQLEGILRDPVYVWQNRDKYQIQWIGPAKLGDSEVTDLLCTGPAEFHLLIDSKTLMIVGCHYQGMTPAGPAAMEDTYSDFRKAQDIVYSFKTVTKANGQVANETTIKEMTVNPTVTETDFKIN